MEFIHTIDFESGNYLGDYPVKKKPNYTTDLKRYIPIIKLEYNCKHTTGVCDSTGPRTSLRFPFKMAETVYKYETTVTLQLLNNPNKQTTCRCTDTWQYNIMYHHAL